MRLVIYNGAQYDADNLPAHVPADKCVPHDEWFAKNSVAKKPKQKYHIGGVVPNPVPTSDEAREKLNPPPERGKKRK